MSQPTVQYNSWIVVFGAEGTEYFDQQRALEVYNELRAGVLESNSGIPVHLIGRVTEQTVLQETVPNA